MVGLINKEDIYDIADAIREKTQTEDTFKPSEMGNLIRSIRVIPENSYQLKEIESTPTSLATFDADALPMPSLKVGIEPVQDLHGYDSPWVGGSGRNLFSVGSRVDGTIADVRYTSDDEYIYLNGTKQGSGYADLSSASNIMLDSGTYYIRAFVISGMASNTIELYPYDGTNSLTSNIINNERTLTLSESKTFRFRFAIWTDGTVLTNYKVGIVVSKTSGIDKFYPYSNICPISGHTEANVVVSPLNISQLYNGQIYGDGTWVENSARLTNVQTAQSNTYFLKAGTYTLDFDKLNSNASNLVECAVLTKDSNFNIIDNFANAWQPIPFTFTLTQDGYLYFTARKDYNTVLSPSDYRGKILGTTYTIDLDGTRYGGTLDVVSGVLTVTDANIASYNGESLPSTWISDRDVYSSGATPTTGAQVVYKLATSQTIQLTPTQVKSLLGTNNVWADTDNILEGEYFKAL